MANNSEGAKKAAQTTKERHGADFYARNARLAQKKWEENGKKPRGFAAMSPERLKEISRKGGGVGKEDKIKKIGE